jgi:hypothetical protein
MIVGSDNRIKRNPERAQRIFELWDAGDSIDSITKTLGEKRSTVGYHVSKFNKTLKRSHDVGAANKLFKSSLGKIRGEGPEASPSSGQANEGSPLPRTGQTKPDHAEFHKASRVLLAAHYAEDIVPTWVELMRKGEYSKANDYAQSYLNILELQLKIMRIYETGEPISELELAQHIEKWKLTRPAQPEPVQKQSMSPEQMRALLKGIMGEKTSAGPVNAGQAVPPTPSGTDAKIAEKG